jgi:hypothetical protein
MSRIYGVAAALLVGVLLFGLGWMARGDHVQAEAAEKQNTRLAEAFAQGQALGVVRDQVVTQYVDRIQVIEKKGATLIKEVPVYVSAKADAACTVNAGFVRLHDYAAAEQPLPAPDPARDADAAPSGIALSAVAETVAGNYTSCRQNAEQLTSLQELLRQYQAGTQTK